MEIKPEESELEFREQTTEAYMLEHASLGICDVYSYKSVTWDELRNSSPGDISTSSKDGSKGDTGTTTMEVLKKNDEGVLCNIKEDSETRTAFFRYRPIDVREKSSKEKRDFKKDMKAFKKKYMKAFKKDMKAFKKDIKAFEKDMEAFKKDIDTLFKL